jgi:choline dehydrogenase
MRLTRSIFAAPALAGYVVDERLPGADFSDDAQLNRYIRESSGLMYHPCGTCKMGGDQQAVVDNTLKVHGVSGLWVADASIFPSVPAGNINATCVMVGAKAADLIEHSEGTDG